MNRFTTALAAFAAGLALILPLASPSQAQTPSQNWPQRNVRFILPLGAGSGSDIGARLLAEKLQARWGQPVVVENRPGGDGIVAINAFVSAKDDHVLLLSPTSSFTAHPFQHEKLPYEPRDLNPIARISNTLLGFAVPGSAKIASVKDLMAQVRAQDGKFNYTTATGVTDVIFDGYFKSAGLAATRVPYSNTVQALTDLGEDRIQAYVGALAIIQPHLQSGRAKLIAVTNSARAPAAPDVPTVSEAGFPELTFDGLVGLFGPRDMPAPLRERIAGDVRAAMADSVIVQRLTATGQVVSPGTPAELAAAIEEQRSKLAAIAKVLGIKPAQ